MFVLARHSSALPQYFQKCVPVSFHLKTKSNFFSYSFYSRCLCSSLCKIFKRLSRKITSIKLSDNVKKWRYTFKFQYLYSQLYVVTRAFSQLSIASRGFFWKSSFDKAVVFSYWTARTAPKWGEKRKNAFKSDDKPIINIWVVPWWCVGSSATICLFWWDPVKHGSRYIKTVHCSS